MRSLRCALAVCSAIGVVIPARLAWADEPKAVVQGVDDGRLRASIQSALGTSKTAPGSRFEARRRAREAAEEAVNVLRSEGYYQYEVEPDVGDGDAPRAVVRITPGPRFVLTEPKVDWGEAPPIATARIAGESSIGLTIGAPGRTADVLAAEGRVMAAVRKRGYADAQTLPREVIVDHADQTVRATYRIDAGKIVRMDGINLRTSGRTRRDWIMRMAPWKPGDVYDPEDVGELERRLLDTEVFDSVTVGLAPKANADGLRPVVVSLADRARATVELGATYSTTDGAGVDGKYIIYNRLGRADTWTLQGQYTKIQKRLEGDVALPHFGRAGLTLRLGASLYRDDTSAYEETGAQFTVDLEQRLHAINLNYRTIGLTFGPSRDQEPIVVNGAMSKRTRRLFTVAGLADWSVDRSNDPLNPTRGWRFELRGEPTSLTGDTKLVYLKSQAQGSLYIPFGENAGTVIASRIKVGVIAGGQIPDVPASQRFFAGGGGSVRGFAYQAVGPRFPDNTPQGGLSIVEASVELRQKVIDRWSAVAFVDAGTLGDRTVVAFDDPSMGVGIGVRYDLGFAPVRADIAIPVNKRPGDAAFQVYLSIGQSF